MLRPPVLGFLLIRCRYSLSARLWIYYKLSASSLSTPSNHP